MIAKLIIGVTTIINAVSFQLIIHKKIRLPKNCIKLRIRIERLSEAALYTVLTSLVNLEINYPVLFLS
jgi:hypothetical protein